LTSLREHQEGLSKKIKIVKMKTTKASGSAAEAEAAENPDMTILFPHHI
jgi:hypothetical protein